MKLIGSTLAWPYGSESGGSERLSRQELSRSVKIHQDHVSDSSKQKESNSGKSQIYELCYKRNLLLAFQAFQFFGIFNWSEYVPYIDQSQKEQILIPFLLYMADSQLSFHKSGKT